MAPSTFATLAPETTNKPPALLLLLQHRQKSTTSFSPSTSLYLGYFKKHTPVLASKSRNRPLPRSLVSRAHKHQSQIVYLARSSFISPNKEEGKNSTPKEQFKPNPTFWLRERVNLGRLLSCCSARFAQTNLLILPYTFTLFCCLVTWISDHGKESSLTLSL